MSNESEEANYNIARAFHQIGILDLAIPFYQKVLSTPEKSSGEESLKREAAYNLSLIYRECGSIELANSVLCEYLVI